MPDTPLGATPHSPDLEFRVTKVEQDMGDMKSILGQILPMIVRIDATLPHLATRAEMQAGFSALEARISGLDSKVGGLAGRIDGLEGRIDGLAGRIDGLAGRIDGLEGKIAEVRAEIVSGDAALRAEMHSELGSLRADLAEKPSRTYLWMVLGVLIMAYATGLAGLALLK